MERQKIKVMWVIVAVALFAAWYWKFGGPWMIDSNSAQKHFEPTYGINFNQQIFIPRYSGSMRAQNESPNSVGGMEAFDKTGLVLGWTPIVSGDDGELLADVGSIHLARKVERSGWFQYIPATHTIDENRNKPIVYELVNDSFNCLDKTAAKLHLDVKYEDGSWQQYFPWGYAGELEIWKPVTRGTALEREMKFICGVQLGSEPAPLHFGNADRLFGTWGVEGDAQGRVAGPIIIAEKQISFTVDVKPKLAAVDYHLVSRFTASTFPGGPLASDERKDDYTTFVLELGEHHCALGIHSITVTFTSGQFDVAHFAAFYGPIQGSGTMRRVPTVRLVKDLTAR